MTKSPAALSGHNGGITAAARVGVPNSDDPEVFLYIVIFVTSRQHNTIHTHRSYIGYENTKNTTKIKHITKLSHIFSQRYHGKLAIYFSYF